MSLGIVGAGTYVPQFRVDADVIRDGLGRFHARGISSVAVADVDEDAVTMAYEAARNALDACDRSPGDVDLLAFASTTPPMDEEDQSVRLGEMLGVPADATRHEFAGSARAGTRALVAAAEALTDGVGIVVASDQPRGAPDSPEGHAAGAAAAAFVLAPEAPISIGAVAEYAEEYPGTRFRRLGASAVDGLGITTYDRDAFVSVTAGAVEQLEIDPERVDAAVVRSPNGDLPFRTAKRIGVDAAVVDEHSSVGELGDTGAANVLLDLARAFESGDPDGTALAVSYGSGGAADALRFEGTGPIPVVGGEEAQTSLTYGEYLRLATDAVTRDEPSGGGASVTIPTWRRTLDQRYRLEAGRCRNCGGIAFVPDGACPSCNEVAGYETEPLDPVGTVESVTIISQGGAPPEFAEHQARAGDFAVAIVGFEADDGETGSVPLQVVCRDPGTVAVGDEVEATIRRIYTQEGVTRYGIKVRPR